MDIDIKREAKILSMMAERIAKGEIKPTQEQARMIIALNDQIYRKHPGIEKDDDLEI